jgi:hypothetical protein
VFLFYVYVRQLDGLLYKRMVSEIVGSLKVDMLRRFFNFIMKITPYFNPFFFTFLIGTFKVVISDWSFDKFGFAFLL